jgi:hypothetical protein
MRNWHGERKSMSWEMMVLPEFMGAVLLMGWKNLPFRQTDFKPMNLVFRRMPF